MNKVKEEATKVLVEMLNEYVNQVVCSTEAEAIMKMVNGIIEINHIKED